MRIGIIGQPCIDEIIHVAHPSAVPEQALGGGALFLRRDGAVDEGEWFGSRFVCTVDMAFESVRHSFSNHYLANLATLNAMPAFGQRIHKRIAFCLFIEKWRTNGTLPAYPAIAH